MILESNNVRHFHTKLLQSQPQFHLWLSAKLRLQCCSLQQRDMSPQIELLKFYNCTTTVSA